MINTLVTTLSASIFGFALLVAIPSDAKSQVVVIIGNGAAAQPYYPAPHPAPYPYPYPHPYPHHVVYSAGLYPGYGYVAPNYGYYSAYYGGGYGYPDASYDGDYYYPQY
jgi:hypothetical protein